MFWCFRYICRRVLFCLVLVWEDGFYYVEIWCYSEGGIGGNVDFFFGGEGEVGWGEEFWKSKLGGDNFGM